MRMLSKYNGTCTLCSKAIQKGTPIIWSRRDGARHATAAQCIDAVELSVTKPGPVVRTQASVTPGSVTAFLKAAQAYIKHPKVRFLAPDGKGELRLSLAGSTSRYPGAVQVKVNGIWAGRIEADGRLTPNLSADAKMVDTLTAIAADPAGAAKAYGALMCRCSFCDKPLTDEGSVKAGYGPICAKHYGLPHTALGTPDVKTVLADEGFNAPAQRMILGTPRRSLTAIAAEMAVA